MTAKYRLAWKSLTTGLSGFGNWFEDRDHVERMVYLLNRSQRELFHWVETGPDWTEVDTMAD